MDFTDACTELLLQRSDLSAKQLGPSVCKIRVLRRTMIQNSATSSISHRAW